MKRSPLRKKSKNPTAECKDRIQKLLRELVILRDGGCVLRHFPEAGRCGGYRKDGEQILQAEHLNSRQYSVSYADPRNIVCLCLSHHSFFKQKNGALYWKLIEKIIGGKRWDWLQRVIEDRKSHHFGLWDWEKAELALKQEIEKL